MSLLRRFRVMLVAVLLLAPLVISDVPDAAALAVDVAITEVHYHPQSVGDAYPDFDDRENTEFVEIANLGSSSADIGGWCFDAGVDHCFAPGTTLSAGEVLVLADDAAAFQALYGFSPDGVYSGALSNSGELLRLRGADGGTESWVSWGTEDPWPITPDGNGPSLELVSASGSSLDPANWRASSAVNGSPGSVPSLASGPLPLVTSRTAPQVVSAGQAVLVKVTASHTTSATLLYRVNHGGQLQQGMINQNGEWIASLPPISDGSIVTWQVQLTGPHGVSTSPRPDDTIDTWATVVPSNPPNGVPVIDLFFTDADWNAVNDTSGISFGQPDTANVRPATVAFGGQVWTDVQVRRAGYTALTASKASLRLDFPDGHPFDAGFASGPVDVVTLDSGNTNVDQLIESLSWTLVGEAGFAPINTQHVRVERNGQFYGLHLMREEQDGDWRGRHNLDRGPFYKASPVGQGSALFGFDGFLDKKEGLDQSDAAVTTFRTCLDQTGTALRSCLLDQADVPQLINEMATMLMIGQRDQREFNWFLYRDDAENGLWRMQPDDLDRVMGFSANANDGTGFYNRCFGINTFSNDVCQGLLAVPDFEQMYNRRIRSLVDEVLSDPGVHTEIDRLGNLIEADWNADENLWNRTGNSFGYYWNGLHAWVDGMVSIQRSGGHDGKVPAAQSTNPTVRITQVRADAGDGVSWVVLNNPSGSESVDVSDWVLTGFSPIPKGTVILPGASVAIVNDDAAFRSANGGFTGVRSWVEGSVGGLVSLTRRNGTNADTWGSLPTSELILNEWNAVSSSNTLAGGDVTFGTVTGNGGDWFELVVVEDGLDVRGWKLVLADSDGGPLGVRDTFEFANDPLLASLMAGTIITVSESQPDDVSFNPATGDWHLNFQANGIDAGAYFTAASQANFGVNAKDWRLTVFDDQGRLVFGPAGEGIGDVLGVLSNEIGELEAHPSAGINPAVDYGDGNDSTFGLPNTFSGQTQNFAPLRGTGWLLGDANCSGDVSLIDARMVAQAAIGVPLGIRDSCPAGAGELNRWNADADTGGTLSLVDARMIAQCSIGVVNSACP